MGQYHRPVCLDTRQYLDPHTFNSGLKLMEFGNDGGGIWLGMAILLADNNGAGGGDFRGPDPYSLIGSWAGKRVVIAGDYSPPGLYLDTEHLRLTGESRKIDIEHNIYEHCIDGAMDDPEAPQHPFTNLSEQVIETLLMGGEAVRFSPHMFKDAVRAQRCIDMAQAMPYHELHPDNEGKQPFLFGRSLRPDMVLSFRTAETNQSENRT